MKNKRLNLVLVLFFIIGAAIISRLFFLQILNHKFYQSQALGQQAGFSEIKGSRGEVFLKNSQASKGKNTAGEAIGVAINKESWLVSAMPSQIEDKGVFIKKLSEIIGESEDFISSKINSENSYVIIKKDLSSEEIDKVKNLDLKGLYWEETSERYYPQEELASNVIGFFGGNEIGQYGIEGFYEDTLKGNSGIKEQKKGLSLISGDSSQSTLDGADLYLTVDYNIQFEAENLLKEAKKNLDIASGQIIVMKPDSGRIIAMASYPFYNPNKYFEQSDLGVFQNASVQKLFEPGSVMKAFTMSIGLNEGKVTPDMPFFDTGSVTIGKDVIYNFNHHKYGQQTMTGVLENSINTGAVYVSQQISHETYLDYMDKFGFGAKTGVDLQGEVYSKNTLLRNGSEMGFATASFGQGIETTPIQLVAGFCAFANGGKLVKPHIVEKIVRDKNEDFIETEVIQNQIVSTKTVSEITAMLTSVVEKGYGGGKVPGYYLAGKTGTAEVPYENKKGYYPDKTIQSFVGYGPALNPQFVILVKLDDPKVSKSSLSAVPVFKKLAQYIINYWQIPPDYDAASQVSKK